LRREHAERNVAGRSAGRLLRGSDGGIEGGEALTLVATEAPKAASAAAVAAGRAQVRPFGRSWHVLWTKSNCEQLVHDQLAPKGFELFLPTVEVWSRRSGVRRRIPVPMFPGYLFIHHSMDKRSYVEVLKARGLVRLLGERWDRLAVVPESEVEAIRRVVERRVTVLPHTYLSTGQRVRITAGALAGIEGILLRFKPNRGLLVISIDLLRRSVAAVVDCTKVVPA
jgi:transcription antitermination factor NusG